MLHLGPCLSQGFGTGLRSCQPQHMMPCPNELWNKCGTDESRCPGHKDTHGDVSLGPTN
jgi:hypothetical protein